MQYYTDTDDAKKNRKQRAITALKSKWKERKRGSIIRQEVKVVAVLPKEKGGDEDKSILSAQDGDTKIDSGRQLTGFGERERDQP
jgi:hypothetical protein